MTIFLELVVFYADKSKIKFALYLYSKATITKKTAITIRIMNLKN